MCASAADALFACFRCDRLRGRHVGRLRHAHQYPRQHGSHQEEAGSEEQQYGFLNAITDPAVSSYMVESWGYGHSNAKGMAAVDAKILADKGFADVDKFTANTLFQSPMPVELRQRMIAEFEKIKSGY